MLSKSYYTRVFIRKNLAKFEWKYQKWGTKLTFPVRHERGRAQDRLLLGHLAEGFAKFRERAGHPNLKNSDYDKDLQELMPPNSNYRRCSTRGTITHTLYSLRLNVGVRFPSKFNERTFVKRSQRSAFTCRLRTLSCATPVIDIKVFRFTNFYKNRNEIVRQ